MNILVVNAGSVTIKYKLFAPDLTEILCGIIDNKNGKLVSEIVKYGQKFSWELTTAEYENAAKLILNEVKDYPLAKVGFRVVHGGELFTFPTLLDAGNISKLETINGLAPLHNPPTLKKIKEFRGLLKEVPFYAVFDTAFHATMAPKAFMYALPYAYYQHYHVRKYGFHGISHQYLSNTLKDLEPEAKKVITCHLGGGASLTAILNGLSIDTSMGFTPLEGLIMATRAGDVDDGAIKYIQEKTKFNDEEMENIENKKSGLLGISGYTSDMRTLLTDEAEGNDRAHLAIDMYVYRIQKYIGAFASALNGVDAVVITGGVGAGSDIIRRRIFSGLDYLGLKVDATINTGQINVAVNLKISTAESKSIWIIPTNEELQIARNLISLKV
jgi:acetate kinase